MHIRQLTSKINLEFISDTLEKAMLSIVDSVSKRRWQTMTTKEREPNQAYFILKHSTNQDIESGMLTLLPISNTLNSAISVQFMHGSNVRAFASYIWPYSLSFYVLINCHCHCHCHHHFETYLSGHLKRNFWIFDASITSSPGLAWALTNLIWLSCNNHTGHIRDHSH